MRAKQEMLRLWKTSFRIALGAITLFSCGIVVAARDISIDAVSEIQVSKDGQKIALVSRYEDGAVIDVVARGTKGAKPILTITDALLSKHLEDARVSSVEWSASGRWLKIEINDGDVDQAVLVLDVTAGIDSLREIRAAGRAVITGSWSRTRDHLYVATSLEDDFSVTEADGIYVVQVAEGRVRQLTGGLAVSARLAVADDRIVTKVQHVEGDVVRSVLVMVDLLDGNITRLLPHADNPPRRPTQ
jgi:hypothetical protein